MIWLPLTYFLLNLIHAIWHWYLIERRNKLVKSLQKTTEYTLASVIVGMVFKWVFHFKLFPIIMFCLITRAAFFDPILNFFRGKTCAYEGEIKKEKGFFDWLENKTGLPTWFFRIAYWASYIIYLIIYLS